MNAVCWLKKHDAGSPTGHRHNYEDDCRMKVITNLELDDDQRLAIGRVFGHPSKPATRKEVREFVAIRFHTDLFVLKRASDILSNGAVRRDQALLPGLELVGKVII